VKKALEVISVYKKFGRKEVIKGISFDIEEGRIVGFVGPNGAGKTTTIKMITGLIKPDSGQVKIFGYDIVHEREMALKFIGSIIENPELYEYLTGYENLAQLTRISNIPKSKIIEVAKLVGIDYALKEKTKKYSLGMKQRLALAMAILTDPKLLVLDEPTNGLDPSGIIELRSLLKSLANDKKVTIFISSHNLFEIQEICDKVVFIKEGKIETIENIDRSFIENVKFVLVLNEDRNTNDVVVKTTEVISCFEGVKILGVKENSIELELDGSKKVAFMNFLFQNGVNIKDFYEKVESLEDKYIKIYQN